MKRNKIYFKKFLINFLREKYLKYLDQNKFISNGNEIENLNFFVSNNVFFVEKITKILELFADFLEINDEKKVDFIKKTIIFYLRNDKDIDWNQSTFKKKLKQSLFQISKRTNIALQKKSIFKKIKLDLNLENNNLLLTKIKEKAALTGNIFINFFESLNFKKEKYIDKVKVYKLGYYLAVFLFLNSFSMKKNRFNKNFQLNKVIQLFGKNNLKRDFLFSKLDANLNYIEILKNFFPKKFNNLVISINKID